LSTKSGTYAAYIEITTALKTVSALFSLSYRYFRCTAWRIPHWCNPWRIAFGERRELNWRRSLTQTCEADQRQPEHRHRLWRRSGFPLCCDLSGKVGRHRKLWPARRTLCVPTRQDRLRTLRSRDRRQRTRSRIHRTADPRHQDLGLWTVRPAGRLRGHSLRGRDRVVSVYYQQFINSFGCLRLRTAT
jgi:hypothetical protein